MALSARNRYPLRSPVEVALILYQRERWALTEAWKQLVTGAITLTRETGPAHKKLGLKFSQAVQALLGLKVTVEDERGKRIASLPERLLVEIDSLKAQAASIESALHNPPSNPSRRLPDDIQLEILSTVLQERKAWAHVLYLLCISSMLKGDEILIIARWLSKVEEDEEVLSKEILLPYILACLLSALETSSKTSLDHMIGVGLPDLLDDRAALSQLDSLINKSTWATPSLQAVVQMQWSLLLVQVVKHDPTLGSELRVTEDSVSRAVLKAIQQGDCFVYIVVRLLDWRRNITDSWDGLEDEEITSTPARVSNSPQLADSGEDEIDAEFQPFLLNSLHSLLAGTTRIFLSLLRKLQRQEEDAAFSTSRTGSTIGRRYDLEALLDSIALVVRGDEARALPFWLSSDGRRSRFITWVVELREDGHQRALLDLLSAMSSGGSEGAWQAHTLLSSTPSEAGIEDSLISWNRLWDWIAYYVDGLRQQGAAGQANHVNSTIPPAEAALLRSFLRLLRSVASGSCAARDAILALTLTNAAPTMPQVVNPFGLQSASTAQTGAGTNVLQRLFALYVCHISIELKASILDALAAFAKKGHPGSGAAGRTSMVRQELWALLEGSGILRSIQRGQPQTRLSGLGTSVFSAQQQQGSTGVCYELEHAEAPSGVYHGTVSFLKFLAALIIPDADKPVGRSSGDVSGLVADLPATSATSGQVVSAGQISLGMPINTSAAAQGSSEFGLEKYLHFAVDLVLLPSVSSATTREFVSLGEKWRVVSAALHFLDSCLMAFDIASLVRPIDRSSGIRGADDRDTLVMLAMSPGFGVMKRLLSSSKLLHEVVGVLSPPMNGQWGISSTAPGYEVVDSGAAKRYAAMLSSAVRTSMSIVLYALSYQDLFTQVLLPSLSNLAEQSCSIGASTGQDVRNGGARIFPTGADLFARIGQSASYTAIDAKLLQEYESVVQMALYVNSARDDLAYLSVKLVTAIAASQAFSEIDRFVDGVAGAGRRRMNRLVGLLEMTDESSRFREGVVRRLDALKTSSDDEDATSALTLLIEKPDAGVQDAQDEDEGLIGTLGPTAGGNSIICRAILDLLLRNTDSNKVAPNIAHLLLGFDLRAIKAEDQVIPTPAPESPRGALHSILDLLRGQQDLAEEEVEEVLERGVPSLLETHPALAEKSIALLLKLCTHPFTTSTTLRYLRTQEDFWTSQILYNYSAYTSPVERGVMTDAEADPLGWKTLAKGDLVFPDGRHVNTSVDALVASLKSRQHLLNGIALELHGLVSAGMQSQAARLIGALYGFGLVIAPASTKGPEVASLTSSDDYIPGRASDAALANDQTGMRLLGLLESFDFEWHDARDGLAVQLSILRDLDISQARTLTSSVLSLPEFDISKTVALLSFARRELERLGELSDARRRALFDREAAIVLHHVSARNAHRAIAASRRAVVASWRNVQDLVLSHASFLFRPEARSTVIFDCMMALMPRLDGPASDEDPVLADLAAGAILSLLTSLRRYRASLGTAFHLTGDFADELPTDRLLLILGGLVGALLRSGTSVAARGNLYSALINYLQLARTSNLANATGALTAGDDNVVSGDGGASDIFSLAGASTEGSFVNTPQSSPLEIKTKLLLFQNAERFVPVIARDALDAPEVWRTVAFTLLDRLCALESSSRGSHHARSPLVLDILSRGGFLKSFVARLRDMDIDLQEVLRPDPMSLNALYVYEAKMTFFGRLAQFAEGAHRLLEAKFLDILAQADFLAAKPEQDQDFLDLESFLPAATERYGAMLLPALQVSVSLANSVTTLQRSRAPIIGASNQIRTGESQASHGALQQILALLYAQRETFASVLREAVQDMTSLATIEESQLIVTLVLQVLPILDDEALLTPKFLSTYHSAILALAAGFLHSTSWRARVVPFTESEREDEVLPARDVSKALTASPRSNAGGGDATMKASLVDGDLSNLESIFDIAADRAVSRLLLSVTSYLEAASETFGRVASADATSGVRACLTSSLAVPQPYSAGAGPRVGRRSRTPYDGQDEYGAKFRRSEAPGRLTSVPSLGLALASMDEQVALLESELATSDRIRSMLENSENVRLEEWDNIVRQVVSSPASTAAVHEGKGALGDEKLLAEMSLGQRRAVATKELRLQLSRLRGKATQRLDMIDVLLVIIYRHFTYYLALADGLGSRIGPGSGDGTPSGVDDFTAPWRSSAMGVPHRSRGPAGAGGVSGAVDAAALVNDGAQMVQLVLERLGRVLLTIQSAGGSSSGGAGGKELGDSIGSATSSARVGNAMERSAFLELVGRKLQTMLLVRNDNDQTS